MDAEGLITDYGYTSCNLWPHVMYMFKESYVNFIAFNTKKTRNSVSRKGKGGIGSHKQRPKPLELILA